MTGRVEIVCTPAVATGFRLAGLSPRQAADGDAAAAALRGLLAAGGSERPAVVLVEEPLAVALPAALQRRIGRDPALLMVPFPSPRASTAVAPEAFLLEILRQAIGYRVRLS